MNVHYLRLDGACMCDKSIIIMLLHVHRIYNTDKKSIMSILRGNVHFVNLMFLNVCDKIRSLSGRYASQMYSLHSSCIRLHHCHQRFVSSEHGFAFYWSLTKNELAICLCDNRCWLGLPCLPNVGRHYMAGIKSKPPPLLAQNLDQRSTPIMRPAVANKPVERGRKLLHVWKM